MIVKEKVYMSLSWQDYLGLAKWMKDAERYINQTNENMNYFENNFQCTKEEEVKKPQKKVITSL